MPIRGGDPPLRSTLPRTYVAGDGWASGSHPWPQLSLFSGRPLKAHLPSTMRFLVPVAICLALAGCAQATTDAFSDASDSAQSTAQHPAMANYDVCADAWGPLNAVGNLMDTTMGPSNLRVLRRAGEKIEAAASSANGDVARTLAAVSRAIDEAASGEVFSRWGAHTAAFAACQAG